MTSFFRVDEKCSVASQKRTRKMEGMIAGYSETGYSLLKQAQKDGYLLKWDVGNGWSGQVDADKKLIVLNDEETDGRLIETLVHECRHIWQFSKGVEYGCGMYNIKDAIRFHRCKEADAEAVTAAVCREIYLNSGDSSAWKAFASGRPFVAEGLERAARNRKESAVSHSMLQSAFNGWYKDERVVRAYEEHYIEKGILTECFDKNKNLKSFFRKKTTSEKIVLTVCSDNCGGCYWKENPFVLNEPYRLLVSETTVRRAGEVLTGIEKITGIKQNHSYRELPIRQAKVFQ